MKDKSKPYLTPPVKGFSFKKKSPFANLKGNNIITKYFPIKQQPDSLHSKEPQSLKPNNKNGQIACKKNPTFSNQDIRETLFNDKGRVIPKITQISEIIILSDDDDDDDEDNNVEEKVTIVDLTESTGEMQQQKSNSTMVEHIGTVKIDLEIEPQKDNVTILNRCHSVPTCFQRERNVFSDVFTSMTENGFPPSKKPNNKPKFCSQRSAETRKIESKLEKRNGNPSVNGFKRKFLGSYVIPKRPRENKSFPSKRARSSLSVMESTTRTACDFLKIGSKDASKPDEVLDQCAAKGGASFNKEKIKLATLTAGNIKAVCVNNNNSNIKPAKENGYSESLTTQPSQDSGLEKHLKRTDSTGKAPDLLFGKVQLDKPDVITDKGRVHISEKKEDKKLNYEPQINKELFNELKDPMDVNDSLDGNDPVDANNDFDLYNMFSTDLTKISSGSPSSSNDDQDLPTFIDNLITPTRSSKPSKTISDNDDVEMVTSSHKCLSPSYSIDGDERKVPSCSRSEIVFLPRLDMSDEQNGSESSEHCTEYFDGTTDDALEGLSDSSESYLHQSANISCSQDSSCSATDVLQKLKTCAHQSIPLTPRANKKRKRKLNESDIDFEDSDDMSEPYVKPAKIKYTLNKLVNDRKKNEDWRSMEERLLADVKRGGFARFMDDTSDEDGIDADEQDSNRQKLLSVINNTDVCLGLHEDHSSISLFSSNLIYSHYCHHVTTKQCPLFPPNVARLDLLLRLHYVKSNFEKMIAFNQTSTVEETSKCNTATNLVSWLLMVLSSNFTPEVSRACEDTLTVLVNSSALKIDATDIYKAFFNIGLKRQYLPLYQAQQRATRMCSRCARKKPPLCSTMRSLPYLLRVLTSMLNHRRSLFCDGDVQSHIVLCCLLLSSTRGSAFLKPMVVKTLLACLSAADNWKETKTSITKLLLELVTNFHTLRDITSQIPTNSDRAVQFRCSIAQSALHTCLDRADAAETDEACNDDASVESLVHLASNLAPTNVQAHLVKSDEDSSYREVLGVMWCCVRFLQICVGNHELSKANKEPIEEIVNSLRTLNIRIKNNGALYCSEVKAFVRVVTARIELQLHRIPKSRLCQQGIFKYLRAARVSEEIVNDESANDTDDDLSMDDDDATNNDDKDNEVAMGVSPALVENSESVHDVTSADVQHVIADHPYHQILNEMNSNLRKKPFASNDILIDDVNQIAPYTPHEVSPTWMTTNDAEMAVAAGLKTGFVVGSREDLDDDVIEDLANFIDDTEIPVVSELTIDDDDVNSLRCHHNNRHVTQVEHSPIMSQQHLNENENNVTGNCDYQLLKQKEMKEARFQLTDDFKSEVEEKNNISRSTTECLLRSLPPPGGGEEKRFDTLDGGSEMDEEEFVLASEKIDLADVDFINITKACVQYVHSHQKCSSNAKVIAFDNRETLV